MKNWIIRVCISSLAVMITAYILEGVDNVGFVDALLVGLVLSFLNMFLRPVLVVLTIPVTIFSLGLFLIVINACIILVADSILDNFNVRNFWWAIIFSLILSFINSILELLLGPKNK